MKRVLQSRVFVAIVATVVTALTVGGVAWAAQSPVNGNVIRGCYNPKNGDMRLNVAGRCPTSGRRVAITWNAQGPHGLQGPQGIQGPAGEDGEQGPPGPGSHEQQITIFSGGADNNLAQCTGQWISVTNLGCNSDGTITDPTSRLISAVTIDRDRHEPDAQFLFEATLTTPPGANLCLRLYDDTANTAIPGSEFCGGSPSDQTDMRRVPITLPPGEHTYVVQQNNAQYQGRVNTARIIVQT
jgi:hypothetical protein